jgi:hypothetical protein
MSIRRLLVVFFGAILSLYGCAKAPPGPTADAPRIAYGPAKLSAVPPGHSRIYFYGQRDRFVGLLFGGFWKPDILLNGSPLDANYNSSTVCFVDVEAGVYDINFGNSAVHVTLDEGKNTFIKTFFEQSSYFLQAQPGYTENTWQKHTSSRLLLIDQRQGAHEVAGREAQC